MRPQFLTLAAVVATVLLFFSSPSFAGDHFPNSMVVAHAGVSPQATPFKCETAFFDTSLNPPGRVACYGPRAIRAAYGLTWLIDAGINGAGRTIVILDAFGSPTALEDLQAFDAAFGIPDPPSFKIVTMPGTPPTFDENNSTQVFWAQEVSLDVQWAHAMAPGANIVLVAAASNSDEDLLAGLNYAINNRLGDVISMSFGESEALLANADGQRTVRRWERAFARARERHMTVLVSSGDQGSTNCVDETCSGVFGFQNVSYPASSPQVTAVGGTNLRFGVDDHADPNGKYLGETVWNDFRGAGGGGVSALFGRPDYQAGLPLSARRSLGMRRGVPDVAYSAGMVGGVVVHLGFGMFPGFRVMGGTSAGAAQWAGIITNLNQALGRPLGFLNNRLYKLGQIAGRNREERERRGRASLLRDTALFHDITVGDNGFCGTTTDGDAVCVPGFNATPGWDLATGWGTPNFGALVTLFNDWDDDNDGSRQEQ
jgi:subtilase family serine protease